MLNAIAADSANDVWAVGSNGLGAALIEHWNGTAWQIVSAPRPPGSALFGIATLSPDDVWAAGRSHLTNASNLTYGDLGTERPLIEHWDGIGWQIVPGPVFGSGAELEGVSGLSSQDVWAVGQRSNGKGSTFGLIEHWNGLTWSMVPSPQPNDGGPNNDLKSVVEITPDIAWAVGLTAGHALIEHWNGHQWSKSPSHAPVSSDLHAVTALSRSDVWAGGMTGGSYAYAEHWNGNHWTSMPVPALGGQNLSAINSFAMVSSDDVWAVGDQPGDQTQDRGLIDHWDGHSWQPFYQLTAQTGFDNLFGAAVSSTAVWAVGTVGSAGATGVGAGNYGDSTVPASVGLTLIGMWNGSTWNPVSSPNPTGSSAELDAIDTLSASDAWAVGDSLASGYAEGLAEHWDGTHWSIVPTPSIAGRNVYLYAIDEVAPGDAWAVGETTSASNNDDQELIEHWDGHQWSLASTPAAGTGSVLAGVSADSADDVWAVGYNDAGPVPLVERWNGASWQVVSDPPGLNDASAVVALSATDVWISSLEGVLDHWNGTGWTMFDNPGGAQGTPQVNALAASGSRDVWSAGYSYVAGDSEDNAYLSLASRWNGASWHEVPSIHPHDPYGDTVFIAIADVSPSNVWAVGYNDYGPVSEHFNGRKFQVVPTAKSIPNSGNLYGADGMTSAVWAVGSYSGDGATIPLMERYASCR